LDHCDSSIVNRLAKGLVVAFLALDVLTAGEAVSAPPDTVIGIKSGVTYRKQCFTVEGVARNQTNDPKTFDHLIFVKNDCFKSVKLKICYHQTDHCVDIFVPPHSNKETWIGAFPAMRFFQYDAKEMPGLY